MIWSCSLPTQSYGSLQYQQLPERNTLGLESEPLCICQESLLLHCQGKFPRDARISITYLAERRSEEVACIGKLPQQPIPNHIWQVYSEVAIQMRGGRREWLLDQLFAIIVTVVNRTPPFPTPAPVCLLERGEKKTPNICRMINRSTSLQIRGSMSYSVLSECITIPGQVFSVGCWQIGCCIHQRNDKEMSRCLHLSPLSFAPCARSHRARFPARHRHGPERLYSRRRRLRSCSGRKSQTSITSW